MIAGTQRQKSLPVVMGQIGRMLYLVKNGKVIPGQARLIVLLKAKNKKLILGQARWLLLQVLIIIKMAGTQRKRAIRLVLELGKRRTLGILKGAMGMVGVGTILVLRLLGANQALQVEIRNLLGASQRMVMMILDMAGADLDVGIEAEGEEGLVMVDLHGMEEVT